MKTHWRKCEHCAKLFNATEADLESKRFTCPGCRVTPPQATDQLPYMVSQTGHAIVGDPAQSIKRVVRR